MISRINRFKREERGGFMLEAVISTPILLFMFLAIIMTFSAFINSMTAMGVLGNQALYLSSLGTWTQAQQMSCEQQLPGAIDWNRAEEFTGSGGKKFMMDPRHNCKVYRLTGLADSNVKTVTAAQIDAIKNAGNTGDNRTFSNLIVPVCQPGEDAEGVVSNTNPSNRVGAAVFPESNVRDCFNSAGKGEFESWFGYETSSATGTKNSAAPNAGDSGPAPLLIEVTYRQEWFPVCIWPNADNEESLAECDSTETLVTRSLIVFSQSRRES